MTRSGGGGGGQAAKVWCLVASPQRGTQGRGGNKHGPDGKERRLADPGPAALREDRPWAPFGPSLTASQELRSPFMLASVEEGLWGSPRLSNSVSGHVQDTQINSNFRETSSSFLVEAHPKCTP